VRWHEQCGDWIRQFDQGRHLITSNFSDFSKDPQILSLPIISYSSTNWYTTEAVQLLSQIYALKGQLNKPALMVECGASFQGSTPATTQRFIPIYLWSSYMMPFAGAGMQWWWDFIEDRDLYYYFKALAAYAHGEERRAQDLKTVILQPVATGGNDRVPGVAAVSLKNKTKAYLWIYDRAILAENLKQDLADRTGIDVSLNDMEPGPYRAEFWDTTKGVVIGEQQVEAKDGAVRFTLPSFRGHMAAKLKPVVEKGK
jgi:hypothetical protein